MGSHRVVPVGGSLALPPVNCISQPGRKAVPGDFFSGAVSLDLGRTSGAQLTGEDKTMPERRSSSSAPRRGSGSLDEAATPTPFTQEEARPLAWATGATGASCHLQSELGPSSFQKVLPEPPAGPWRSGACVPSPQLGLGGAVVSPWALSTLGKERVLRRCPLDECGAPTVLGRP